MAASGSPRPLNDEQVWALMYPTAEQAWAAPDADLYEQLFGRETGSS